MLAADLTTEQTSVLTRLLNLKSLDLKSQLEATKHNSEPVTLDQQSVGRVSRIYAIQQQQMAVANREQSALLLTRVLTALQRVDSGDYGVCLECGESIGFARLEVQPATQYCLDCQSAME